MSAKKSKELLPLLPHIREHCTFVFLDIEDGDDLVEELGDGVIICSRGAFQVDLGT